MGSDGRGRIVPVGLWDLVEPLPPVARLRPQGGGTAKPDDEAVSAAIVSGPSKSTVHRRFRLWTRDGPGAARIRRVFDATGRSRRWYYGRTRVRSTRMTGTATG
ncbi:hypothetical protein [Kitasatospora phosalacinea]|uniref:hypothetical protein n=1 Tax=Kitasatospora phosalacinea TaxID=2065 RepID=UPI0012FE897E|nr:hypothetical protein [Kitasatospora phosalacinea]